MYKVINQLQLNNFYKKYHRNILSIGFRNFTIEGEFLDDNGIPHLELHSVPEGNEHIEWCSIRLNLVDKNYINPTSITAHQRTELYNKLIQQ